jgi:undecaprenyl-diphosphatase
LQQGLFGWNVYLFHLLNAPDRPSAATVLAARLAANDLVFVVIALAACLWLFGPPSRRGALLAVGGSAAVALGLAQLLGQLWFEPRPFMIGLGHTLLAHAPENSFPSDHATLIWSLGLGLIATGAAPVAGWIVCALGLIVAWARIYLGVHFPVDMAASLIVAAAAAALARLARPLVDRRVLPGVERAYEVALGLLRLPPALFPRRIAPSDR